MRRVLQAHRGVGRAYGGGICAQGLIKYGRHCLSGRGFPVLDGCIIRNGLAQLRCCSGKTFPLYCTLTTMTYSPEKFFTVDELKRFDESAG